MEIRDDRALLKALSEDGRNTPTIYRPGPYWLPYQDRMLRRLRKASVSRFRQDPMLGKGFADGVRTMPHDGSLKSHALRTLTRLPMIKGAFDAREAAIVSLRKANARLTGELCLARSPWLAEAGLPDTLVGGCEATTPLNGSAVATKYLLLAERLRTFEDAVPAEQARSYLEVGGGFGAFAHLLLTWRAGLRKAVLIDIPPVVYIATQYLRAHCGNAVRDYVELRDGPIRFRDDDSREILCLPTWAIERLEGPFDLFHNAASFSEMTPEIVRNYAEHWKRLSGPGSTFWLFLNKTQAHDSVTLALPSAIERSFDWLSFDRTAADMPGVTLTAQRRETRQDNRTPGLQTRQNQPKL